MILFPFRQHLVRWELTRFLNNRVTRKQETEKQQKSLIHDLEQIFFRFTSTNVPFWIFSFNFMCCFNKFLCFQPSFNLSNRNRQHETSLLLPFGWGGGSADTFFSSESIPNLISFVCLVDYSTTYNMENENIKPKTKLVSLFCKWSFYVTQFILQLNCVRWVNRLGPRVSLEYGEQQAKYNK